VTVIFVFFSLSDLSSASSLAMRIIQILDHIGIYLVIAGTLTPILLVALQKHTFANVLVIFEWVAALLGIGFASEFSLVLLSLHHVVAVVLSFSSLFRL
jgi:channel protein (hemolysin III family)